MNAIFGAIVIGAVALSAAAVGVVRGTDIPPSPPCVPTERMPIAGLNARPPEPMPVLRPDSTRHLALRVFRAAPCYLADSSNTLRSK